MIFSTEFPIHVRNIVTLLSRHFSLNGCTSLYSVTQILTIRWDLNVPETFIVDLVSFLTRMQDMGKNRVTMLTLLWIHYAWPECHKFSFFLCLALCHFHTSLFVSLCVTLSVCQLYSRLSLSLRLFFPSFFSSPGGPKIPEQPHQSDSECQCISANGVWCRRHSLSPTLLV